jgi:hypothetical protein
MLVAAHSSRRRNEGIRRTETLVNTLAVTPVAGPCSRARRDRTGPANIALVTDRPGRALNLKFN